jgi:hypothetical protein
MQEIVESFAVTFIMALHAVPKAKTKPRIFL